jgi:hypothetical protein
MAAYRRHPDCRHYDDCLGVAARGNLLFDCRTCRSYQPAPVSIDSQEYVAMLALLAAVFKKNTTLQRVRHLFFTQPANPNPARKPARSERSAMSRRESAAA